MSATIRRVRAVPTVLCCAVCALGAVGGIEACASFGTSDAPGLLDGSFDEREAGGAGDTGGGGTEAGPDGGKADGPFVKPPLTCGGAACTANDRCCMNATTKFCAPTCAGAWEMQCFGPADCEAGACCHDPKYPTSFCAASCPNYKLCTAAADCAGPQCITVNCDKPSVGFRVCAGGAPAGYHDYPGTIPSCTTQ